MSVPSSTALSAATAATTVAARICTTNTTSDGSSNNKSWRENAAAASDTVAAETQLRNSLRMRLHDIYKCGALEPTYKNLLLRGAGTSSIAGSSISSSYRTKHSSSSANGSGSAPGTLTLSTSSGGTAPLVIKFPRDKLYRKVGAEMRRSVESLLADPASSSRKRGMLRDNLGDGPMRTAFTLRECKRHEQEALVRAAIVTDVHAGPAVQPPFAQPTPAQMLARKRRLDAIAGALQEQEKKEQRWQIRIKAERARALSQLLEREKAQTQADLERIKEQRGRASHGPGGDVRPRTEEDRRKDEELRVRQERMEQELQNKEREIDSERSKVREREREISREKEEAERRARLERSKADASRKARMTETPQQALRRLYEPIFDALWDMEFENLHGTNPFRIVIDAENCVSMGVPDYTEIIKKPMNLTYIRDKVKSQKYESLQQFFSDVELLINNALMYNSDQTNPYHFAAQELKRKYKSLAKKVVMTLRQQQQHQKQQKQSRS